MDQAGNEGFVYVVLVVTADIRPDPFLLGIVSDLRGLLNIRRSARLLVTVTNNTPCVYVQY
jgi:hypothetical protein